MNKGEKEENKETMKKETGRKSNLGKKVSKESKSRGTYSNITFLFSEN